MSNTKGIKKFVLAYELYNSGNTQCLIDFTLNHNNQYNFKHIKVEKYKGITTARKAKFTLSEIDKMTTKFPNRGEFLKSANIDYGIYDFFIGTSKNGYIQKLKIAFNNPSLYEKTKLVKGDVINDKIEIENIVELLINTNSKFYSYLLKHDEYYKSFTLINKVQELRRMIKVSKYESNLETTIAIRDLTKELHNEVKKYNNFRDLFLAKTSYLEEQKPETKVNEGSFRVGLESVRQKTYLKPEETSEAQITFDQYINKLNK